MKSRKKNLYQRKKFQKRKYNKQIIKEFEYPEFTLKIAIVSYDDLKKWNLINEKTFREYLKKCIEIDFEGGDLDE